MSQPTTPAKPLAAYSPLRALRLTPNLQLLYISGTTARQGDGAIPPFGGHFDKRLTEGTPSAAAMQMEAILQKLSSQISSAAGGTGGLENLIELTIFVKDLPRDYVSINEVYDGIVGQLFREKGIALPARTCVQVSAMPPDERTLVEVKGVAKIEGN